MEEASKEVLEAEEGPLELLGSLEDKLEVDAPPVGPREEEASLEEEASEVTVLGPDEAPDVGELDSREV